MHAAGEVENIRSRLSIDDQENNETNTREEGKKSQHDSNFCAINFNRKHKNKSATRTFCDLCVFSRQTECLCEIGHKRAQSTHKKNEVKAARECYASHI